MITLYFKPMKRKPEGLIYTSLFVPKSEHNYVLFVSSEAVTVLFMRIIFRHVTPFCLVDTYGNWGKSAALVLSVDACLRRPAVV